MAQTFYYGKTEFWTCIIDWLDTNHHLSEGLGFGLGTIFRFLPENFREEIINLKMEKKVDKFSEGLGLGIGKNFKHLDDISQAHLLDWVNEDLAFSNGLAYGLALNFPSLDISTQVNVIKKVKGSRVFQHSFMQVFTQRSWQYLSQDLLKYLSTVSGFEELLNKQDISIDENQSIEYALMAEDLPSTSGLHEVDDNFNNFGPSSQMSHEVLFSGHLNRYCVCLIDIVNSTNTTAALKAQEISKYFTLFLNSMAIIIRNFGGQIIKNAGDGLIFYFQTPSDVLHESPFEDILECLFTMIDAHDDINAKLAQDGLPSLNYRISADYGKLERVKSASSKIEDLFGSAMNICERSI